MWSGIASVGSDTIGSGKRGKSGLVRAMSARVRAASRLHGLTIVVASRRSAGGHVTLDGGARRALSESPAELLRAGTNGKITFSAGHLDPHVNPDGTAPRSPAPTLRGEVDGAGSPDGTKMRCRGTVRGNGPGWRSSTTGRRDERSSGRRGSATCVGHRSRVIRRRVAGRLLARPDRHRRSSTTTIFSGRCCRRSARPGGPALAKRGPGGLRRGTRSRGGTRADGLAGLWTMARTRTPRQGQRAEYAGTCPSSAIDGSPDGSRIAFRGGAAMARGLVA